MEKEIRTTNDATQDAEQPVEDTKESVQDSPVEGGEASENTEQSVDLSNYILRSELETNYVPIGDVQAKVDSFIGERLERKARQVETDIFNKLGVDSLDTALNKLNNALDYETKISSLEQTIADMRNERLITERNKVLAVKSEGLGAIDFDKVLRGAKLDDVDLYSAWNDEGELDEGKLNELLRLVRDNNPMIFNPKGTRSNINHTPTAPKTDEEPINQVKSYWSNK